MEKKSDDGARIASKWNEIINESLRQEIYQVVHRIGRETFSIYVSPCIPIEKKFQSGRNFIQAILHGMENNDNQAFESGIKDYR